MEKEIKLNIPQDKLDFIYHVKGALSFDQCNNIIKFYDDNEEYYQKGSVYDLNSKSKISTSSELKKCTEIFVSTNLLIENKYFQSFDSIIIKIIDEYKIKYNFLNYGPRWGMNKVFKIQKYLPSEGYFATHCENQGSCDTTRRMLAWMVYLNTVTDGGETEFPCQGVKFQPHCGDVLIWPAYWTHPHHGLTSPSQEKIIMTGWYSYYDT